MRLAVLLFSLATFGCANSSHDECGDKFLLLWPTASKEFKFQEVHLSTLKSPYELKGSAAEIFFESRITDSGYEGSVARPRLTRSGGGVCVPMDAGSSMALTAYAHFEQLYYFDRQLKVDRQISWPRKVGVEIHLSSPEGETHNNAHYFSKADAIAVIPYTQDGLTLSLNPGVLAHEHFHSHFQAQVIAPLNSIIEVLMSVEQLFYSGFGIKPEVDDVNAGNSQTTGGMNKFVIRSWNEGLADFYGAVFSDNRDFFSKSLSKLGPQRDLSGPIQNFRSGQDLINQFEMVPLNKRNAVGVSYSYHQGTMLARVLYRIALSGIMPPTELLKHILLKLPKFPAMISPAFSHHVMDFEDVLPSALEGITLNPAACETIKATVSKSTLLRSFSSCGN